MTRVRITVEGDATPSAVHPDVGAEAMVTGSFAPYHWNIKGTVTAVEQITPPLTAEEALAEIERRVADGMNAWNVMADIRRIITRTKVPQPTVGTTERWWLEASRAVTERDAAYAALREIDGWAAEPSDLLDSGAVRERIAKVPGIGDLT